MYRNDYKGSYARLFQIVVASPNVRELEPFTLERL